jgi:hypothetical protein
LESRRTPLRFKIINPHVSSVLTAEDRLASRLHLFGVVTADPSATMAAGGFVQVSNLTIPSMVELDVAVSDAQCAAEMAAGGAAMASEWAEASGIGEDDAREAISAAIRAHVAAESTQRARSIDEAWQFAAAAWAAAETALDADGRVVGAIAEALAS